MCTAISFGGGRFFGRTLDHEEAHGERPIILPQNKTVRLVDGSSYKTEYSAVGMATRLGENELFFDGVNERGLAAAGLNLPTSTRFRPSRSGFINLASHELIGFILGRAGSLAEAEELLLRINITPEKAAEGVAVATLHYIFAEGEKSIVFEQTEIDGRVFKNPVSVLTNEPPFPDQLALLNCPKDLCRDKIGQEKTATDADSITHANAVTDADSVTHANAASDSSGATEKDFSAFSEFSDFESKHRFLRAAFIRKNLPQSQNADELRADCFSALRAMSIPKGCVSRGGSFMSTRYISLMDTKDAIYYYSFGDSPVQSLSLK